MTTIISERTLDVRVDALPWTDLADQLDSRGFAVSEPLLGERECSRTRTCSRAATPPARSARPR
jgi:hypothetical protein